MKGYQFLSLVLLILRATGQIGISWWLVFLPVIIVNAIDILCIIGSE